MTRLAAALLLAFAALAPADDRPPATLRVLTYNIHHGEGTDGKLDLARIAKVITDAKPDLVAVQEVDRNTTRTNGVDQAAELGKRTGLRAAFGKAIDLQGGAYGQAILSRFPLKGVTVHPLPGQPKQETRIAVETTVEPPGRPAVRFVGTHFQHDDGPTREKQAAKVNDLFGAADGLTILAGDLNATPDSEPLKALGAKWAVAGVPGRELFTIPSDRPRRRIDYVLVRPAGAFKVLDVQVIDEPVASDHRPVLAVLEWAAGK